MNEQQYRELEELRTYLNVKQKQKLANKIRIRELRKTITATKAEKLEALTEKRRYMIMDKELRSLHEITNQKDWTLRLRN